ncbi:MAG TPA: sulfotransferase [Planctomycetota bacterium]|nr:sulfotransferase [Planctomycetota bacterium]
MTEPTDSYGLLDRMLHRLAFATTWAQRGTADIEERLFRRELQRIDPGPPVLITALPRAGTTILLELLAGMSTFASHTYRDMPFVLSPMLWRGLSQRFRKQRAPRERAHGDGIQITLDSPEAFEEVVWRTFWPQHYETDRIRPWRRCDEAEFLEFLTANMRKVVALRAREKPTARRYVSKNNLNVARIPALFDALGDAVMLVPFREPLQHAWSLLQQHRRFGAMHEHDAFARRYMAYVGHFDFGANLKPVDFDGWLAGRDLQQATSLGFWLDYWIATYRHVLSHATHDRLHLVCFESLGAAPDLAPLAACIGGVDASELQQRRAILEPPRAREVDASGLAGDRVEQANGIYEALRARARI